VDALAAREGLGVSDEPIVVGGERRVGPVAQQPLHEPAIAGVHLALGRESDLGRLVVGALAEPHARTLRDEPLDVVGAAPQIGLDDGAHLGRRRPQLAHEGQRRLGLRAVLHVHAHEGPDVGRLRRDAFHVLPAERWVHVEAHLRQLQADVAVQAALRQRAQRLDVTRRGFPRRRGRGHGFAEDVQGRVHAGGPETTTRVECLGQRLAGHEPPDHRSGERDRRRQPTQRTPVRGPDEGAAQEVRRQPAKIGHQRLIGARTGLS